MNCVSCGTANPEDARFCEKCGRPIEAPVAQPVQQTGRSPEEAREAAARAFSAAREAVSAAPPSVFFMSTLVGWVSRGDFFRRFVSLFLRVLAVVTAVGGGLLVITVAVGGFRQVYGVGEVLALLLILLVMAVAVYMYSHLFLIRAKTVIELPPSQYNAIPVASVIVRLAGEQLAVASVIGGVVGLVVALFAGGYAPYAGGLGFGYNPFVAFLGGGGAFLSGLGALLGGLVGAFFALIISYMLAEAIVVIVDIARDVRSLKDGSVTE